ncbi:MAG: DUF438 domain-containing protein, partial [Gemmatimonadetes bacterium]|nr:DUF438 domain-containing protein [Gemmatimonadota bacterium]
MEEELIRGGLPVTEVQRLCDVHIGAFRHALDQHAEVQAAPGHPVHTYLAGNRVVTQLAEDLSAVARDMAGGGDPDAGLAAAAALLERLAGVDNHYRRKEYELFPVLERHGVSGPSQVMWGVHDEIRAQLKAAADAVERRDAATLAAGVPALSRALVEMVYKEEKILFPLAMDTLSDGEWAEIREGEDELGYVLAKPACPWPGDVPERTGAAAGAPEMVDLGTGALSPEQVNLVLKHLPVELTFVDETDTVRYYSTGPERIFPRTPGVIGRKVQNCHPPASVHIVNRVLEALRSGERDVAEFWITHRGKFVHIRYFAVRDGGSYRGCLEAVQDVSSIRALEGERRLLDWE